jgi:hypothetical protein
MNDDPVARLRKGGLCHDLVGPHGDWRRQIEVFQAEQAGDVRVLGA